jgi:hypothetical protein
MNHHTCNRIENLHHYEHNGTYHRVLLAIHLSCSVRFWSP